MRTRVFSFLLIVAAVFILVAAPASARYPLCSSASWCGGQSPSCPCSCFGNVTSTCAEGCSITLDLVAQDSNDWGLPRTLLDELGIFAYNAR